MRKKILLCILLAFMLTGCQEKEPTIPELKQQVFENAIVFDEDITETELADKTPEYKNLFKRLYSEAITSVQYDAGSDTFTCNLYNVEDYKKIVQQDTNGFQKDYENMLKLEVDDKTISNYIYSYCTNALGACGKELFSFQLDLGQNNSYKSNAVIVESLMALIDEVHNASINYTKVDSVEEWVVPTDVLDMGMGRTMVVSCEDKNVNCYVRIDSCLIGQEAEEYVRGLSSINSTISFTQEVYVITYTIINLGTETVKFTDKILSVNENGNTITFNNNDVIGLEYAKSLEPKIETTITNLYVGTDSGVLLWYDEVTNTSFKVNILSN